MASEIRIVRWIDCDEADEVPGTIGWLGGRPSGRLWPEYIASEAEWVRPYLEAIRTEVISHRLNTCGDEHQDGWIPMFSDGTAVWLSFRAWGDLMSAIWNTELGERRFGYMDFYMAPGPDVADER